MVAPAPAVTVAGAPPGACRRGPASCPRAAPGQVRPGHDVSGDQLCMAPRGRTR